MIALIIHRLAPGGRRWQGRVAGLNCRGRYRRLSVFPWLHDYINLRHACYAVNVHSHAAGRMPAWIDMALAVTWL